jgi:ElaA protein
LDDKDLRAYHYSGWEDEKIIAYTRLLAKGISYEDAASIGRVVTAESVRGKNIGKQLMRNSIDQIHDLFGDVPIRISAQLYLKRFYESLSFVQKSGIYMEDGIEHISMLRVVN